MGKSPELRALDLSQLVSSVAMKRSSRKRVNWQGKALVEFVAASVELVW